MRKRMHLQIAMLSIVVAACAPAPAANTVLATNPHTETSLERSGDEVRRALEDLSEQLTPELNLDQDVTLAWTDFEGDLRSVVDDLLRNPDRVDVDGMRGRIDALGELIANSEVGLPESHWEEFVAAFSALVDELGSA